MISSRKYVEIEFVVFIVVVVVDRYKLLAAKMESWSISRTTRFRLAQLVWLFFAIIPGICVCMYVCVCIYVYMYVCMYV